MSGSSPAHHAAAVAKRGPVRSFDHGQGVGGLAGHAGVVLMPAVLTFLACLVLAACSSSSNVKPILLRPACPQVPTGPGVIEVSEDEGLPPGPDRQAKRSARTSDKDDLVTQPPCHPLLRLGKLETFLTKLSS